MLTFLSLIFFLGKYLLANKTKQKNRHIHVYIYEIRTYMYIYMLITLKNVYKSKFSSVVYLPKTQMDTCSTNSAGAHSTLLNTHTHTHTHTHTPPNSKCVLFYVFLVHARQAFSLHVIMISMHCTLLLSTFPAPLPFTPDFILLPFPAEKSRSPSDSNGTQQNKRQ